MEEYKEKDGCNLTLSPGFVEDLTNQIRRERELTQLLGVALKAVLPAAERGHQDYVRISALLPNDALVKELATTTQRNVQRGWAALNVLDKTDYNIRDMTSYQFDEIFEIKFEE